MNHSAMSALGNWKKAMFNLDDIFNHCSADIRDYYFRGELLSNSPRELIYVDRNSKVLAIAHLDTVQRFESFAVKGDIIQTQTLDDRLGAYIILDLLPNLGIFTDVLLTTNEERGLSTAQLFSPSKQYNWMFQFDRGGITTVSYQYETKRLRKMLKKHNLISGIGSYTDICELGHLGCLGFNVGTGYYDGHAKSAHADLAELKFNVRNFVEFYREYKDEYLYYNQNDRSFVHQAFYEPSWKLRITNQYYDYEYCDICNTYTDFVYYYSGIGFLCQNCADELENYKDDSNSDFSDLISDNPTYDELNRAYDW